MKSWTPAWWGKPKFGERALIEATDEALTLALNMLFPHEPGDSRAVSDEFVAIAAVHCGDTSPEVMDVIRRANARFATLEQRNARIAGQRVEQS